MKLLTLLCLALLIAVGAHAQVSGGISVNDDGVNGFYLAIGQNYHVPEREVRVIHERQIPDDEIPVVFFIADRAHVRPNEVVELRRGGQSWMDITRHYHLDPSIYYVALEGDPGTEYGQVYGNWRRPNREWKTIRFDDDDIVKMVNLQFVSEHYGVRPDEVVRLRGRHGNFVGVNVEVSSREYRTRGDRYGRSVNGHYNDYRSRYGNYDRFPYHNRSGSYTGYPYRNQSRESDDRQFRNRYGNYDGYPYRNDQDDYDGDSYRNRSDTSSVNNDRDDHRNNDNRDENNHRDDKR